jgi:hypothetical protein
MYIRVMYETLDVVCMAKGLLIWDYSSFVTALFMCNFQKKMSRKVFLSTSLWTSLPTFIQYIWVGGTG